MSEKSLPPLRSATPGGAVAENPLSLLWRSIATGLGYVAVMIVGGMLIQVTRLTPPPIASQIDPQQALLTSFIAAVVVGLTLGPLARRLPLPAHERAGILFLLLFMVQTVLTSIEGLFFTTYIGDGLGFTLVSGALQAAGLAVLLALLFPPPFVRDGFFRALGETLATRSGAAWLWRFTLAGLLYVPIYLFFGSLVAPIVLPYYRDPAMGLGLTVPGYEVILPLEAARGLLYVLAVFPLVAVLRGPRRSLVLWIGLAFVVLGAVVPFVQGTWMPLTLRLVHGLEITADSFIHAAAIAWLLAPRVFPARRAAPAGR